MIKNDISRFEFLKHQCIQSVEIRPSGVLVKAVSDDPKICEGVMDVVSKAAEVLDYCRMVVSKRTSFTIQQQRIILDLNLSLMLF